MLARILAIALAALFLTACGGGGDQGRPAPDPCPYTVSDPLDRAWVGTGKRVLFIGDSLIASLKAEALFPEFSTMNQGVSGQCTTQIAARFARDVMAHSPEVLVLEGGINDIARLSTSTLDMKRMTLEARNAGIFVIIVGVYTPGPAAIEYAAGVQAFHSDMLAFSQSEGIQYIDNTAPSLLDGLRDDGIHLTPAGYDTLRTRIKAVIP